MVIIHQPLSDQILIVLYMLVQLFELVNLQLNNECQTHHEQQERIQTPCDQVPHVHVLNEQRNNRVRYDVRHGQRETERDDHGNGEFENYEGYVHVADAVSVRAFDGRTERPVGAHHRDGAGYFRVEHAQRPVLPDEEYGRLVDGDAERNYYDHFEEEAE